MSTLWNTDRGRELFGISLAGGLADPDAREFPTEAESAHLIQAQVELMDTTDQVQNTDYVTTAADFLRSRGVSVYKFSIQAIERVRGQMPIRAVELSLSPNGETISLTTINGNEETREDFMSRYGSEDDSRETISDEIRAELNDMASAASTSVDVFDVGTEAYLYSTNTLRWPDGRSAEFDTSDIGFWVSDYLFAMNLIDVEQRLTEPQAPGS